MTEISLAVEDDWTPRVAPALATFEAGLADVAATTALALLSTAQDEASGLVLHSISGAYRASLAATVTARDGGVSASLTSSQPQAAILEYGGTTAAHDIVPVNAKALRFGGGVGEVYAAIIHDPGATIGEHPVLRGALAAVEGEAEAGLDAVMAAMVAALS